MKNCVKVFILIMIFSILPSSLAFAKPQTVNEEKNKQLLFQIKEKRQLITEHEKANKILETKIDSTSRNVDHLLTQLPYYTNISDDVIEKQLVPKFDNIMDRLVKIGDVERSKWKYLKLGNKQIANKNYTTGLKYLNKASEALEQKHTMLIELNTSLEDFLKFLKQLELK